MSIEELQNIGVRPHKEKINISKEIINKTRGAEAPYAARMNVRWSYGRSKAEWLTEIKYNSALYLSPTMRNT